MGTAPRTGPVERALVGRGLGAGALAGLCAFVPARLLAEPVIGRAIDYESARDKAQAALDAAAGRMVEAAEPEVYSRTVQADVGALIALVAFGVAMGALLTVAYAVASRGPGASLRPRALALLTAGLAFLGVTLLPSLKYPANPPGIGHPDTIRDRGTYGLILTVLSVALVVAAVWLARRLTPRLGGWNAVVAAGVALAVAMTVVYLVLPQLGHLHANVAEYGRHATETPLPLRDGSGRIVFPGFPADDLWTFRLLSVGAQALLWLVLGLVFGALAERLARTRGRVTGWGAHEEHHEALTV